MIRQIGTQLGLFCMLVSMPLQAQITSDGTVGTTVSQVGMQFDITGGTQISNNLFHSFGIFDVNMGETASFQGPAGIANILGRVTGGSVSNIDGTLQSTISGANLYLINPAGVMFGPNASLDVQGSFHVTTADYVLLGSDGRFDTSMPANTVLTASTPSAFGFVSATPAPIEFNSSFLRTQDMATLSVIGGDITLTDATLHAMEGRINIASVASAGEVLPLGDDLDTTSFTNLGDIHITHSTDFDGRPKGDNFSLPIGNIDVSGNGAGDVYIRSGSFYSDNGQVYADTQRNGAAGSIDIDVRDELKQINEARITSDVLFAGASGDVTVDARHVVLESGSVIRTLTIGSGDAGNVVVNANETITVSGVSSSEDPRLQGNERSGIGSETRGAGAGGTVDINTSELMLSDEATLSTVTLRGPGGSLNINANNVVITDLAAITLWTFREGNAGQLVLNTDELKLSNGGAIDSRSQGGGDAGNILINVGGTFEITGFDLSDPADPQPGLISSNAFAEGNGGTIEINAGRLAMSDGGLIQANIENDPIPGQPPVAVDTQAGSIIISADDMDIRGGAQVISGNNSVGIGGEISVNITNNMLIAGNSTTNGQASGLFNIAANDGSAGDLQVSAGDLRIENGASINTSTLAAGNGGNVELSAASISLRDAATVSAKSTGTGNAGTVTINAATSFTLQNGSSVTTAASIAGGGLININARDVIYLGDSEITSSVVDGSGNGGDITIDPIFVILDNSRIIARADAGNGGNISITTDYLMASPDSLIDASSNTGIDGEVVIDSPNDNLVASLAELPENLLNAAALLKQRCAARDSGAASSFVVTGPGGVPTQPGGLIYSSVPASYTNLAVNEAVKSKPVLLPASLHGEPAFLLGCSKTSVALM